MDWKEQGISGWNGEIQNMIICSKDKFEVGSIVRPVRLAGEKGEPIEPQPLFVIRAASKEEYLAQDYVQDWIIKQGIIPSTDYYYEVSTD